MIGALVRARLDASAGYALITSRASFEMVQKAAAVGIAIVVAVSAPTAMAIRTATSLPDPPAANAEASAIRNQAVTSSMAAAASAVTPVLRVSMPRSARIRDSPR